MQQERLPAAYHSSAQMGSSPRARLFPVLSLMIMIIFLSISTNGISSFDCGNGLTLTYPFHPQLQVGQPTFCGYPDLAISCTNNHPILHISDDPYIVTNLNISARSITVAYAAGGDSCPIASHAVRLDSDSILNYSNAGNKIVRFYYNCTAYPPSGAAIKCLQRGAKQSYALVEGSGSELPDWISYCETNVSVPVMESAADDLILRNGSGNSVLQLGFKLRWESVDRPCQLCEESGGFCGYNSVPDAVHRKFRCICGDARNTSLTCHVLGEVSKTFQFNYVSIGLMVLGVVVAFAIAVFFVNKMNIGVPEHGFNRLPTISGR